MKEVLQALVLRPMTPAILARTVGVDQEVLGEMVTALIAEDLIEEDGNKLVITAVGLRSLEMSENAVGTVEAGSILELGDDVVEVLIPEHAETNLQVPSDIDVALAKLNDSLNRQVKNLPTKLAVLERLSEILDPSIAVVLAEIHRDLKVAA